MRHNDVSRVIHWFSPLPPAQTDIAEYTRRILPALASRAKVILWTDQSKWDTSLEAHATVQHFDPRTFKPTHISELRQFLKVPARAVDALFVNIGNNWAFHADLLAMTRRMPSIVVLHDLTIQEMLLDAVRHGKLEQDTYLEAMSRTYGSAAREAAVAALAGKENARSNLLNYPGAEVATDGSLAIVSHSPIATQYFAREPESELVTLNLPYPCREVVSSRRMRSGPLRLLQFGHIGPNRRILEILDILGNLRHRLDFRFDIVGQVWDERLLQSRIQSCGLKDNVHLHGFLPEADLDQLISEAHLVFNLRYPTMGEASGSQLRIWSRAACSVVSDLGWYATLPKMTILKISPEPEAERAGLERLLIELDMDRLRFAEVGQQGFRHLQKMHDPDDYAEEICRLADRVIDLSRELLIHQQAGRHRFLHELTHTSRPPASTR